MQDKRKTSAFSAMMDEYENIELPPPKEMVAKFKHGHTVVR